MAQELMEYLRGRSTQKFSSVPHYFPDGDFVTFYASDVRCYAERVDELLTVYRQVGSNDLVGCKIKGVRRILGTLGHFAIVVADNKLMMGVLFMAAALDVPAEKRQRYQELAQLAKDAAIDQSELPMTA